MDPVQTVWFSNGRGMSRGQQVQAWAGLSGHVSDWTHVAVRCLYFDTLLDVRKLPHSRPLCPVCLSLRYLFCFFTILDFFFFPNFLFYIREVNDIPAASALLFSDFYFILQWHSDIIMHRKGWGNNIQLHMFKCVKARECLKRTTCEISHDFHIWSRKFPRNLDWVSASGPPDGLI